MADVLFTHKLKNKHLNILSGVHFKYKSKPLIDSEILDFEIDGLFDPNIDFWVFTSKKAVKSISKKIDQIEIPSKVFAVGDSTKKKLQKIGIEAKVPEDFSSESLAKLISEHQVCKGIHFCGNLTDDLIKDELKSSKISLEKRIVYKTILTPTSIDTHNYDAVVFLSPSAFDSFCEKNDPNKMDKIFCIGTTTAKAVGKSYQGGIITPSTFTFSQLVKTIDQTFQHAVS